MEQQKRYRITFSKASGGYDEVLGDTIASLKHQLKDKGELKNCKLYDTPTSLFEGSNGDAVIHGVDDVIEEYETVNDFLNDNDLDN